MIDNSREPHPWDDDFDGELNEFNMGLTPGEACKRLNLEIDELWHLVLDGAYARSWPQEAKCWPALFDWYRIQELRSDPALLAQYRSAGNLDFVQRMEIAGIPSRVPEAPR